MSELTPHMYVTDFPYETDTDPLSVCLKETVMDPPRCYIRLNQYILIFEIEIQYTFCSQ